MPLTYAPDALPGSPEVIASGAGLRPTVRGYANFRALVQYGGTGGWAALSTAPNMLHANNWQTTGRLIAGADTALYQLKIGGTWQFTVSTVGSGFTAPSYPGAQIGESSPDHWCFTNYGDVIIASNKFNSTLWKQTTIDGTFSAITGSPAAGCLVTWRNFIIAGDCGSWLTVTGTPDMVAWSALGDYTDWTPCVATQSGWNRLLDVNGRIVAMLPIGDSLAIYKGTGIWLAQYSGPPAIFAFQLLDGERGINVTSDYPPPVVDIGKGHIFVTRDDICRFDGANVVSIAAGRVRDYLLDNYRNTSERVLQGTHITHDRTLSDVYFWTYGLVYNYAYDQWGRLPAGEAVIATNYSAPLSIDAGTAGVANDINTVVAKSDNKIYSRVQNAQDGTAAAWAPLTATFSEIGDNSKSSTMRRVVPIFRNPPTSTPTLAYSRKEYLGATATSDGVGTWDSSRLRFDLLRSAYWHQTSLAIPSESNGTCELIGMEYDIDLAGKRTEGPLVRR